MLYFVFAYRSSSCLGKQYKIDSLCSIFLCLAHQCSMHSIEQRQKISHSIFNYFYRHLRCLLFSRSLHSCRRSYARRSLSKIINLLHISKPIPRFQFDCVPPVVNVAHRQPVGHLSAMLSRWTYIEHRTHNPSSLTFPYKQSC